MRHRFLPFVISSLEENSERLTLLGGGKGLMRLVIVIIFIDGCLVCLYKKLVFIIETNPTFFLEAEQLLSNVRIAL